MSQNFRWLNSETWYAAIKIKRICEAFCRLKSGVLEQDIIGNNRFHLKMFCKVRFIILFYALKYLNEKSTTIILKTWDKKQWNQGTSPASFWPLTLHCTYWSHWTSPCSSLMTCPFASSWLYTHCALTWNSLHFFGPHSLSNEHSFFKYTVSFRKFRNPPRLGRASVLGTSKHPELTLIILLYCNFLFICVL